VHREAFAELDEVVRAVERKGRLVVDVRVHEDALHAVATHPRERIGK
jgi:hypothetical protein